jgi:hypothetical protein
VFVVASAMPVFRTNSGCRCQTYNDGRCGQQPCVNSHNPLL